MSGVIDLRGLAEVQQMLDQVSDRQLVNRTERALRAGIRPIRAELRRRVRSSEYPRTFGKTRTKRHRNPIGLAIRPVSPLLSIFEAGARPHEISAPVMAGKAGDRWRSRDFFARGDVRHPGMKARPILAPVLEATAEAAERAFTDKLLEGI